MDIKFVLKLIKKCMKLVMYKLAKILAGDRTLKQLIIFECRTITVRWFSKNIRIERTRFILKSGFFLGLFNTFPQRVGR
jgi:hypothetical protein